MIKQLRTRRHLPPGTALPEPVRPSDRTLLADLLALADESDPLLWLQTRAPIAAADVTFRLSLVRLGKAVIGAQQAHAAGRQAPPRFEASLGKLLTLPADAELLRAAVGALDAERHDDDLRGLLYALKRVRRSGLPAPNIASGNAREVLMFDLLALPDDVEPTAWLQHERGPMAAAETLAHLLSQTRPPRTRSVGIPEQILTPANPARTNDVEVSVDRVVLGDEGFSVAARALFSTARMSATPRHVRVVYATWSGFQTVIDDRGYQYLIKYEQRSGGSGPGRLHVHARAYAAYYPSVPAGTRELAFISDPTVIRPEGWRRGGSGRIPIHPLNFGALTWTLEVPH